MEKIRVIKSSPNKPMKNVERFLNYNPFYNEELQ